MKKITFNENGLIKIDESLNPEEIKWIDFSLLVARKEEEYLKDTIIIDCILPGGEKYILKFPCDTKDRVDELLLLEKIIEQQYNWVTSDWVSQSLRLFNGKGEVIIWERENLPHEKELFETVYVEDWDAAKKIAKFNRGLAYRGQPNVKWDISTSFERAFDKANPRDLRGINNPMDWYEETMLYEFKRKAFLYERNLPNENNTFEWLALMQHYGCPTRLLDFTWSFYVAAFFAIQGADKTNDIAIWGISPYQLNERIEAKLNKSTNVAELEANSNRITLLNELINMKSVTDGVILLEPYKLNERISSQQGLFAVPLNLNHTFIENLMNLLDIRCNESLFGSILANNRKTFNYTDVEVSLSLKAVVHKIIIPSNELYEIRRDLHRMNITYETLFPGLEGYSKSLENLMYPQ